MEAKRKRRPVEAGEFDDPLKNYADPPYADELERAICGGTMADLEVRPFVAVPRETPLDQVVRMMAERDIACVLVTDSDGRLVGIVSERDILSRAAERFGELRGQPVAEIMTPQPAAVYETDPPAKAMNLMATGGFRHIPVLDVDDRVVGIVGPRRVTHFLQSYFI